MHRSRNRSELGFTMVELLMTLVVTIVIVGGGFLVFTNSAQSSTRSLKYADIQTEARAALSQITRDLSQAGTGVPLNGIPIPSVTTGGANPNFACDAANCYTAADIPYTQGLLYKVTPGNAIGPTISEPSDAIKVVYVDPTLNWAGVQAASIAPNGGSLTMPAGTVPAVNDPALGITPGDVMLLQNVYGSAVGVVTDVAGQTIIFGPDALNINQLNAPTGNIQALGTPGTNPLTYPATQVSRLIMVTYFIQSFVGPDGPDARIMRQVGSHAPIPIAEHIEDLKFTYDVVDPISNALTANSLNAVIGVPPVSQPNQIRKVNISVTARAARRETTNGDFLRINLTTSIGPRNLSFRDRYK
jgi:type II secretory pathway pseudopilin PulG